MNVMVLAGKAFLERLKRSENRVLISSLTFRGGPAAQGPPLCRYIAPRLYAETVLVRRALWTEPLLFKTDEGTSAR